MIKQTLMIGPWIRRFLVEHLVGERNLSPNTQRSYRDTFVQLVPRLCADAQKAADHLEVGDLSADRVRAFLSAIEQDRKCGARTRNQRLAAIHAFARFIAERAPEWIEWCGTIRTVPFKRFNRAGLCYLDKPEMDALLAAPDSSTPLGRRDHALLLFLYNSGARASEAAAVTIADLERHPDGTGSVRLNGKGAKTRFCPLWEMTMKKLAELTNGRAGPEKLFINQRREPLTRYGIHALVRRHVRSAAKRMESLSKKCVSPHTIRHTTATHLLRAGVDINTIRAWLGHVSIDTTNIYAESDLEAKAQLIERCDAFEPGSAKHKAWKNDRTLMAFLRSL